MASKAYREAAFVNFLSSFAKSFMESKARDKEEKQRIAEQMLEQQEKESRRDLDERRFALETERAKAGQTVVGPKGEIYQTSGISPEFAARVRLPGMTGPLPASAYQKPAGLPGAINVGQGKLSVQRPPKPEEEVTNVSVEEFNANPDLYRDKKIKVVPSPSRKMTADTQFRLFGAKEIYKEFLRTGTLNESQATQLDDFTSGLDINLVPEEEQGFLYGIQKLLSGPQFQPKVAKKDAGQPQEIKKRDPRNGKIAVFDGSTKKFLRYE